MSGAPLASIATSRPKIHRPPAPPTLKQRLRLRRINPWLLVGFASLASLAVAVTAHNVTKLPSENNAPTLLASLGDPAALSPAAGAAQPSQTMVFKDKSDTIIGQMAKIPMENEQITELKPVSDIDNNAGRELLSIISKY